MANNGRLLSTGWRYTDIPSRLSGNPDMEGQDLGGAVVECYVDSYRNLEFQWPLTQGALDADGLDGLPLR